MCSDGILLNFGFRIGSDRQCIKFRIPKIRFYPKKIFRSRIELLVNASKRFNRIVLKLRIVESQLGRAPSRSFRTPNIVESQLGRHREFALTLKHVVRTLLECVRVLLRIESQLWRHRKIALKWKHVVRTIVLFIFKRNRENFDQQTE